MALRSGRYAFCAQVTQSTATQAQSRPECRRDFYFGTKGTFLLCVMLLSVVARKTGHLSSTHMCACETPVPLTDH